MLMSKSRPCPLCNGRDSVPAFPYATNFNNFHFNYIKCSACLSIFVDPVPDSQTFAQIYAKEKYHDLYYEGSESGEYSASANLLKEYLPIGATVLDYGCGLGAFLKGLVKEGFIPCGVEFDVDAARFAGHNTNCKTFSVDEFRALIDKPKFDAIHLGDVLEHLPDPAHTLKELLDYLKPDGLLFIEGPLEINPSPVYFAARTFGWFKRIAKPYFVANHAPTHLFLTDSKQQKAFFQYVEPRLDLLSWNVYETGWPYNNGGLVKFLIGAAAKMLSGQRLFGVIFGNRFRGVFRLSSK